MQILRSLIQKLLKTFGYRLIKVVDTQDEPGFLKAHEAAKRFTMTSVERQRALYEAVSYISENRIEGDVVECGVWKGGSSMIAALALGEHGDTDRTLYLYDTYAGMSEPTDKDVNLHGNAASGRWHALARDDRNDWDYASLKEVQENLSSTGYPEEKLRYVEGKVEETIPGTLPNKIALLRLDTDWYESTKHELIHLFPRLVPGGVLILDDYGHWEGARRAVDEYFAEHGVRMLLNRIDYTGRIGIKI